VKPDDCYYLIPARMGSKGFPLKNRKLFEYTIGTIPESVKEKVFVSTDDDYIKNIAVENNIGVIDRPQELAQDETSMKDVLKHFIEIKNISCNDNVTLLYLTYPERTWRDVEDIYSRFLSVKEKSLVCCEEVEEHPYLCFHEKENNKAQLIVDHKFYRRQDYPSCLRLSMFVACYKVDIVEELHDLMFEEETYFYKLEKHKVDVDYLDQFLNIPKEEIELR
jgi:CMP-N-acetylneuraminic acid synthetase